MKIKIDNILNQILLKMNLFILITTPIYLTFFNSKNLFAQQQVNNSTVCKATNRQEEPKIVSDGKKGSIITWIDKRDGISFDIYAQRINENGDAVWGIDGVPICINGAFQYEPCIASDGNGGAIIAWTDTRGKGNFDDIYAQHIDSNGTVKWTLNGIIVTSAISHQNKPKIISDGNSGAIICWEDNSLGNSTDILAQKINTNGTVAWKTNGVIICSFSGTQFESQLISDGNSGAIISWQDDRGGYANRDIYAQKVNANGTVAWTANGVPVCSIAGQQKNPRITTDGNGGAIICWEDGRNIYWKIYTQKIDQNGVCKWASNGVLVCNTANDQDEPTITSDNNNGAIIAWNDQRIHPIKTNIFAQKINSSGVQQWTATGVALGSYIDYQGYPFAVSDGNSGAIIAWQNYDTQHYAQQVNSNGVIQWGTNALLLNTNSGGAYSTAISYDGNFGATIAWHDKRNGSTDIFTQHILNGGIRCSTPEVKIMSNTTSLCQNDSLRLWAQSLDSILWQDGIIDSIGFIPSTGIHNYSVICTRTNPIPNCKNTTSSNIAITVNPNINLNLTRTACGNYTLNNETFTISGIYIQHFQNSKGCDSTITLNLTIKNRTTSTQNVTVCDAYTWFGNTYSTSGIYTHIIPNSVGCDSTITLNLTIKNSTAAIQNITACYNYIWFGNTYTTSGTYTHVLTNNVGCDSTITLNLTIKNSTTATQNATACDTYTWFGNTYTSSGIHTHVIPNKAGCDSTITLNLTINKNSTSTQIVTACNNYTWFGTNYKNSGTYLHVLPNKAGCDSTITLNLTINPLDTTVAINHSIFIPNVSGATYQWLDCGNGNQLINGATTQSYTASDKTHEYAVIISKNGCSDTSSCLKVSTLGLNSLGQFVGISIYPNPTSNELFIVNQENTKTHFEILNAVGQVIFQGELTDKTKVETSHFATGVYVVKLENEKGVGYQKVVKE